ncbi:MAG: hypothetical protein IJO09_07405 [Oscillospiraceae bacterium]|nr:hypothetical protein [Oscillospiraceae bacterium]
MQKTRFGISAQAYAGLAFLSGIISPIITLVMTGAALIVEENDWLKRMVLKAFTFVLFMGVAETVLGDLSLIRVGKSSFEVSAAGGLVAGIIDALNGLLSYVDSGFNAEKVKGFFGLLGSIVGVLKVIFLIIFAKKAFAGQYVKLPVVDGVIEKNAQ